MATLLQPVSLNAVQNSPAASSLGLRLQCPRCNGLLEETGRLANPYSIICGSCDFVLSNREGIWRALTPHGAARYKRFIQDYETVRLREGRGSGGGHYYLALPFKDISGGNSWQWGIRARTFRFVTQRILPVLEYRIPGGLDILDLGAGNGWLSYRLALRGHRPVAVDLLVNHFDGLGAARHYLPFLRRKFPRFQAEMDRLPFAPGQFDLAIFNASFHYSEDYDRTLDECLRCLRRPGHILILDSPSYFSEESGEKMVSEKKAGFEKKYGFKSDSISSCEFLTPSIVASLAQRHRITWEELEPWYGLGWWLRPLRARLLRRREPAKFHVFWGTVE
jgi:SAM-dependent methyltransferase